VAQLAPAHVVVESVRADSDPGQPTASISLLVRNTGPVPLTVATERRPTDDIEIDLSPTVSVPAGGTAIITTRALVHDCLTTPGLPPLDELPNPVPWAARSAPGIALQVGLGTATTLASYPLVGSGVGAALADGACRGAPAVSAVLTDVEASSAAEGGWEVRGVYELRSDGVRLRVGREHFAGPPAGEGSILTTPAGQAPGGSWEVAPTQLDGGAGRVLVRFVGTSCDQLRTSRPVTLPVGVTMADRTVYAYEIPVDDIRLVRAAYDACGIPATSSLGERGWTLARTA
jgi:hypothetical protein